MSEANETIGIAGIERPVAEGDEPLSLAFSERVVAHHDLGFRRSGFHPRLYRLVAFGDDVGSTGTA